MEALFLAASPFLVTLVTMGVKKIQAINVNTNRVALIRLVAALFSFAAVVLGGWASGEAIDSNAVVTVVEAIGVFAGSQLIYWVSKKHPIR